MRPSLLAIALLAVAQEPAPREPETILHRMGDLRWQHGAYITSIAVLPGDKQVLTSGYNGAVLLTDLESGAGIRTFEGGHQGRIFGMALFPDGKRFVTCGGDKKVILWELESSKPVRVFDGHKDIVRSVGVTSDGTRIVSGGHDAQVLVWDPAGDKPVHSINSLLGTVVSLAVQPRGKLVLVDGSHKAGLCDWESGQWVKELAGPEPDPRLRTGRGMEKVAFSPDGRLVAAYFSYSGVTVWEVESGKEVKPLGKKNWSYSSITFSRDGKRALLGTQKSLEIWDVEKGELVKSVGEGNFHALAEMEEGGKVVATTGDGSISQWDLGSGKRLSQAGSGEVFSVAYFPDGKAVLSGARDGSITQWDVATGRPVRTFERLTPRKFGDGSPTQDWAASIAIAVDGRTAISGHWDCRTARWDLATGKVRQEYSIMYGTSVQGVAVSPDGRLAAGSGAPAVLWDIESGEVRHRFAISAGAYTAVAFSPDGASVLLGTNSQKLSLFDAGSGALVREFSGPIGRVAAIDFTPDGRHAVSASESGEPAVLWEVATGRPVRKFAFPPGTPPSWGAAIALSPDGAFLYTRSPQSELLVWSVESGTIVRSYSGHLHHVKSIAFSTGGRFVATGSADTTVILRHPGLPFKPKAVAWADAIRKDPEQLERNWKRFAAALRSPDFDVWADTMERGVALGDALLHDLYQEFQKHPVPIRNEKGEALLKELDKDDVVARDQARQGLSALGEGAYAWAREQMNDEKLSATVRADCRSFCREIEARPLKPLEMKDIGELRAVLILIEQPESERRSQGLEQFAKGPMNSVPARLARRYMDQVFRR